MNIVSAYDELFSSAYECFPQKKFKIKFKKYAN